MDIKDDRYGDALYSFVQALLKITDVTYLSRERVKSTFLEDFRAFIESSRSGIPPRCLTGTTLEHDPEGKYIVDCRINGRARPVFVQALPNDDKVRDTTIAF